MGYLLYRLQASEPVSMPHSRPMPAIGTGCHELRVNDTGIAWRLVYRIDQDAIVVAEVFQKKARSTPAEAIENSRRRLRQYDASRQRSAGQSGQGG